MMKKILYVICISAIFIFGMFKLENINTIEANNLVSDNFKEYEDIIIKKGRDDKKVVALTFDDGPDEDFTPQILDILKKHNVKGTFFVIGEKVGYNGDIVKRAFKEGHEIANHTFTHINVSKKSYDEINKEIIDTQNIIKEAIGEYPTSFRPPYRGVSKNMCDIIKNNDMDIILWSNIDPRDWSNPGVDYIVNTITSKVENGNIILLHDYNKVRNKTSQTIQALDMFIPKLKEKGFDFVTIHELKDSLDKDRATQKQQ